MKFTVNVYDKSGNVVKVAEASPVDLEFGAIRAIMELLNVDSIENTAKLMRTVYDAWDQFVDVLGLCFPSMEYDDWNHVKLKELIPTVMDILKYTFAEILTIPKDPA